uniref:Uncharacterized protein ycf35 n=1 Tax=Osmundaria fimbriata TaxID=228265 RepID=A0A1Z1M3Z3_OSMFI|nr:hypothetical protein [Osmundaria fimbriata]ARW60746.1 hypothetical protein [Osmundaria fimbriata]
MSHFSKIKTNISNLDTLKLTIKQLGFAYEVFSSLDNELNNSSIIENLCVYYNNHYKPLFSFVWSGSEYNFVADLQLWNLDINASYFLDRLSQQYAYNTVISQGTITGFQKVSERMSSDGSIKITLQKWAGDLS